MTAIARITLLTLILGLSACAFQRPSAPGAPPTPPSGPSTQPGPSTAPGKPVPSIPKALPRTSATFAPPPGGASHWDPQLGVYVLEGQPNTFYRQRTYYRWSNGWSRAISPQGPWEDTDVHGVPSGLGRKFTQ